MDGWQNGWLFPEYLLQFGVDLRHVTKLTAQSTSNFVTSAVFRAHCIV